MENPIVENKLKELKKLKEVKIYIINSKKKYLNELEIELEGIELLIHDIEVEKLEKNSL